MLSSSLLSVRSKMPGVVSDDHAYVTPKRHVLKIEDMMLWEKSEAYQEYIGFIHSLNEAVKGKACSSQVPESEGVNGVLRILDTIDKWIDETPPIEQPQRFGNQAFKTWLQKVVDESISVLKEGLSEPFHRAIPEIMYYYIDSFGNGTRIDYGTGHEMSFLFFLCCLFKIGVFSMEDKAAVVLKVFRRYLEVVRKLQVTYRMEPAGSHGVWSLDDYQFVPFIWGSSQLVAHPRIEPKSFLIVDIVERFKDEYLFLGCIDFIMKMKTGPFAEHSNQLWNVSAVPTWSKVSQGLIKMYKAEILAKFPVIQHVLFGSLLPFKIAETQNAVRGNRLSVTSQSISPDQQLLTSDGANIPSSK